MSEIQSKLTVRDLRRKWKPTKERLNRTGASHPLSIRLHRAFSWMAEVEKESDEQDYDKQLLFLWIAFNALYGKWDASRQVAESDAAGIKNFVTLVRRLDKDDEMLRCLVSCRELATELICDQYLNKRFWRTINTDRHFNSKKSLYLANEWFESGDTTAILDELLERIYFNRCQLIHGASTFNSKLNRESVGRSALVLGELLRSMIIVIVDHGLFENWDGLCYPPIDNSQNADFMNELKRRSR